MKLSLEQEIWLEGNGFTYSTKVINGTEGLYFTKSGKTFFIPRSDNFTFELSLFMSAYDFGANSERESQAKFNDLLKGL